MDAKTRAMRTADAMWAEDAASKALGMKIVEVDEGRAVLHLTVASDHLNGHGMCHGGIIFSLADSAFAFACNSRNQATVAQHNTISYLAPARLGDTLIATATEVGLSGRSGITDVSVKTEDGRAIAVFRGASRAVKGHVFEEGI
ncbi:hydroxyphenylacetyl-CoA thioesterase PaaI [Litoreibacter roseus]|uniref:hydroxyphenylacetyl-CoA thioesterase PaaI n=1 Tax=Litoreibacter roseus TaxID=2601869 RepID=UPI001359ED33|nr:hydroxyphenylacetyl-CoA thioesterase PaaI [Litoreibacter roseus]